MRSLDRARPRAAHRPRRRPGSTAFLEEGAIEGLLDGAGGRRNGSTTADTTVFWEDLARFSALPPADVKTAFLQQLTGRRAVVSITPRHDRGLALRSSGKELGALRGRTALRPGDRGPSSPGCGASPASSTGGGRPRWRRAGPLSRPR